MCDVLTSFRELEWVQVLTIDLSGWLDLSISSFLSQTHAFARLTDMRTEMGCLSSPKVMFTVV